MGWIARGVILAAAVGAGLAFYARRLQLEQREPRDNPAAFLKRERRPGTRYVVVCAGDSITHGVGSANYVALLRRRLAPAGYAFVNGGINGNLAYNVLQRLDAIITCRPDYVTLLIGTNDVNATFDDTHEAHYREAQNLPETPTLAWYRQNVTAIVDRLQAETTARIALIGIPMLGEDLDSAMNARVARYNAALSAIAAEKGVTYLPLYEPLRALFPPDHAPPPYNGDLTLIPKATAQRYLLRRSWDAIAAGYGFAVLTDHLHLNDKAAAVVADQIAGFLQQ